MADTKNQLPGKTKMAILMGVLPIEIGREIIKGLDLNEKQVLSDEIRNLSTYSEEITTNVLREYVEFIDGEKVFYERGTNRLIRLLEGNVDPEEYDEMVKRYFSNKNPLAEFKKINDIGPYLSYLQREDPQTIAVVASYFKPSQAAELLESLPDDLKIDVVRRIANMEKINKKMLDIVEKTLKRQKDNLSDNEQSQTDGTKNTVNILNNVNRSTEKYILEKLEEVDPELAKIIKDNMFIFEDLLTLDQKSLSVVFSKISENELIAKALKKTKDELKEKIYKVMAKGRIEMIKDIEENSQFRLSEVEEAQQQIANRVKELEKSGDITIARGEQDIIV